MSKDLAPTKLEFVGAEDITHQQLEKLSDKELAILIYTLERQVNPRSLFRPAPTKPAGLYLAWQEQLKRAEDTNVERELRVWRAKREIASLKCDHAQETLDLTNFDAVLACEDAVVPPRRDIKR